MPDVQKVSVALTGEQVAALKEAVETGEYATTSEIVREAIREWQWKREFRGEELERLRAAWEKGVASGRAKPMGRDQFLREAYRRLQSETQEAA
jgi:antitoxin ParD1/3/4